MRSIKNWVVASMLVLAAPAAFAEVPATSPGDRQALQELNARWLNAYRTRDGAALGNILADDFIGLYGQSALSKAQMLEALARRHVTDIRWENLQISVNGNTAVVTAISTLTTMRENKLSTARYRYADVYARRDGQWRAIASHVVRFEG